MSTQLSTTEYNKALTYKIGEKCLCYHGPMIYEAKVSENYKGGEGAYELEKSSYMVRGDIPCKLILIPFDKQILKAQIFEEKHPESNETGPHYLIHYKGWKNTYVWSYSDYTGSSWDEWVVESRVLKFNEANLSKQKQLKTAFSQNKTKASAGAAASSIGSITPTPGRKSATDPAYVSPEKSKKRKRELFDKNDLIKRQKLALFDLPEPLKALLVHDWECINKSQLLVPLPRSPTVQNIIVDYKLHLQEKHGEIGDETEEVLKGVKLYFNKSLGGRLLYQDEREQYREMRNKYEAPVDYVDIYGAEHLLRLFVTFPEILNQTLLNDEILEMLKELIVNFININSPELSSTISVVLMDDVLGHHTKKFTPNHKSLANVYATTKKDKLPRHPNKPFSWTIVLDLSLDGFFEFIKNKHHQIYIRRNDTR
ncbi:8470_t:CDS:2 [Ambispora gerdemannii]|uniref:Chromatin modification-related protein EAF3 n=1 Tax=Ambispora gerdemannii TaxID=144530 RepID=A0A9N9BAY5_9GLOM|nr:8470_t:CDS:2 [Ambispora gerdemannii]